MAIMNRAGDLIVWEQCLGGRDGNKRFFYFHDILIDLIIKGGERLRKQIILISMLILWASAAYGANNGVSANLDIMGSFADNTVFIPPEGMPVVVDIVGSTATNIQIGNPGVGVKKVRYNDGSICGPCGEKMSYVTPWDDFKRPLCYPWSSYIPTRYSQSFINMNQGPSGNAPEVHPLGQVMGNR